MLYGCFEVNIKCPKCDAPVPLNGPWEVAHCDRCQADVDIPHDYWLGIFRDTDGEMRSGETKEGEGSNSTIFGTFHTTMMYGHLKPYCPECNTELAVEVEKAPYVHKCPKCDRDMPVVPVPAWLKEAYPPATVVVGGSLQGKEEGGEEAPTEPIAFSCIKCGGALMVDGTERVVPCEFCGVKVYLPDDLWLRMHPAKVKERWRIGFDEKVERPKGEDDEE